MNKENLHTIFSNSECISEEKLIAYCNNELTNPERNDVEQHTINCKFCSDALEGFEKDIHTTKGYYFAKAAIRKKEKKNKSFIITITGIAASCLAFVLLINELNTTQTEQAENKITTEKRQKEQAITPKYKSDSLKTNALANLKNTKDTVTHIKQNYASGYTSDSINTVNFSSEALNSNFNSETSKPHLKEKSDENLTLFEENIDEEEEDVKYHLRNRISDNHFDVNTQKRNEVVEPQKRNSKSKKLRPKKIDSKNEIENHLNKFVVDSDTYFEENEDELAGYIEYEVQLDQDSLNYEFSETTSVSSSQADKSLSKSKHSLLNENKRIISLNQSDNENESITDSLSFSVNSLDSLAHHKEFDLGVLKFNNGKYKQAIEVLKKIQKDNINYFEAQLLIGKSYIKLGNNEKAKPHLKNVLTGNKSVKLEAEKLLNTLK